MAKMKKNNAIPKPAPTGPAPEETSEAPPINLSTLLTRKAQFNRFTLWVVGETPLIVHAWSEKARREMLEKQVKAVRPGKEARDPRADFMSSLYAMGKNDYGFPATGFKNAVLSCAHKDKGIPRSDVMRALWIDAEMVSVRPALQGAICNMPLIRVYGSEPEMREDMVRIGAGLKKTASLAYRGQFTTWAFRVTGKVNTDVLPMETLVFLIVDAGTACGVGEWRNEKKGMFGAFHPADMEETEQWEAFANGGPLPVTQELKQAAE
jgi:hypothetical protein